MKNNLRWDNLTRPELARLAQGDTVVILPLGSTEQHGPHLPVGTDALIATAVCERVAARLAELGRACVVAPTFAVANALHHLSFPGTMTLWPGTYAQALFEQVESIRSHGFKNIVLINAHGGNRAPTEVALVNITEELDVNAYYMMYTYGSERGIADLLETQDDIIHACEGETSMMLHLYPHLVDPIYKETKGGDIKKGVPMPRRPARHARFETTTENGCWGNAYMATAEKGEAIVALMAENLAHTLADGALWA